MRSRNLLVLLQIKKGDGVPVAGEGILGDDANVIRPEVQMAQPVQSPQGLSWNGVDVVVAEAEVLEVFCKSKQKPLSPDAPPSRISLIRARLY